MRRWRGGRWARGHGWLELRRQGVQVAGVPPIRPRLTAIADVPDLDLLPDRLPGRPAVTFRAGTELAAHNLALWLLSWPVRWRWLRSLAPLARLILGAQRLTAFAGGDRSAMTVRLFGIAEGRRVERRWTLIASNGDGPEIPGLAVPIILDLIGRAAVEAGARDAGDLLDLTAFEPAFSRLSIGHEIVEIESPPPLYARVMGTRFDALPPAVRAIHDVLRDGGASGRAEVRRGRSLAARLIAAAIGFPPEGGHALHVHFEEQGGVERWTRSFSGHRFASSLSKQGPLLVERFGLLRFGFDLPGSAIWCTDARQR